MISSSRPRWQRCNLLIEQLLRLLPYPRVLPILELEQAGEECVAEGFTCFSGKQAREVVYRDHAQRWISFYLY